MKKEFTGLLDKDRDRIYNGDLILSGMRRGDANGWTTERVRKLRKKYRPWNYEWVLADPKTGELMEMQWDQELRIKCEEASRR